MYSAGLLNDPHPRHDPLSTVPTGEHHVDPSQRAHLHLSSIVGRERLGWALCAARATGEADVRLVDLLPALPRYRVVGNPEVELSGIACDSRTLRPGTLFVAYGGINMDGHGFVL